MKPSDVLIGACIAGYAVSVSYVVLYVLRTVLL